MARCEVCGKETFTQEGLQDLFDRKACEKCIKDYEIGDDHFQLKVIAGRRGKLWILKNLLTL